MKPGRGLDYFIAKDVMDIQEDLISVNGPLLYKGRKVRAIDYYSTDISAAWDVAEHLKLFDTFYIYHSVAANIWVLEYQDGTPISTETEYEDPKPFAIGESAEHVICLGALKLLGINMTTEDSI